MRTPNRSRPLDWRFLMVLFSMSTLLDMAAWGQVAAFTPLYLQRELGVPPADVPRWTGILASASLAIAFPLSPFWGVLADRYSRKAVIVRAELVAALAYAGIALCTDVWQLLLVRLLLGFAYGNIAVVMATQAIATPGRSTGTAVGVIQTAATVGMSAGPLLGSLIINAFGMRALFAANAGLALTAALLIILLFRDTTTHDRATPLGTKLKLVLRQVAAVPHIRWNFIAWFLVFSAASSMDPFLPVLIDRISGVPDSPTTIGILLAGYGLLTGLGTPIAGWLAVRVGTSLLFLIACVNLAVVAGGVAVASTLPVLAILVLVRAGPQSGTAVVLYSHLATHVPREHRAAVMSLTPMPRNLAWLVAPAVASAVSGFGLSAVFWLAAALYGAAGVVALLMMRASEPN